jgi:hypothetical protein
MRNETGLPVLLKMPVFIPFGYPRGGMTSSIGKEWHAYRRTRTMKEARKKSRIYRPASLEMKIEGKHYRIHNICEEGMAFFTDDPSFVSEGDFIRSISLNFGNQSFQMEGEIIHISSFSHLHSNIPDHSDTFVVGVKFRIESPERLDSMKRLLSALHSEYGKTL